MKLEGFSETAGSENKKSDTEKIGVFSLLDSGAVNEKSKIHNTNTITNVSDRHCIIKHVNKRNVTSNILGIW